MRESLQLTQMIPFRNAVFHLEKDRNVEDETD